MKQTFAGQRFQSVFLVSTLSMAVEYVSILAGSIIAGQMLGELAIAAVAFVMPFFETIVFFSYLIAIGVQAVSALAVGAGDRAYGNRLFSLGVILVAAVGGAISCIFLFLYFNFSSFFVLSPEMAELVRSYFRYICIFPIIQMLNALLFCILINEGGETLCLTGSLIQIVSNILLAVILCAAMGIGGISLSAVLSNFVLALVLACYFKSPRNKLRFQWYFKWADVFRIIKYSVNEASAYLFLALSTFLLNRYMLRHFGETGIMVLAVILNVQALLHSAFDGIGDALSGLINTYKGENNYHGIKKTMSAASVMCMCMGIVLWLVLLLGAGWIPGIMGISSPDVAALTVSAVRIYSCSALLMAFLSLYVTYYTYMEYIMSGLLLNSLHLLVLPVVLTFMVGTAGNMNLAWAGLMAANLFSLLLGGMLIRGRFRRLLFPLLIKKEQMQAQLSYDVLQNKEEIMKLVNLVEQDLKQRHVERSTILRIMLMIEESQMLALERSKSKHGIIECSLLFGEKITLILRDSGSLSDPTDGDGELSSAQSYTAMRIVYAYEHRQYLLTSGFNRTVFYF